MALSRFYVGQEQGGMPPGYGFCQRTQGKDPIHLKMVMKGQYWFPYGSPFRYRPRELDNVVFSDVCTMTYVLVILR